jgi:hypothetical protein
MFENKIFIDLAAGLLLAAAIGSGAPRELRAQDGTHTATPCRAGDSCVRDTLRETSGSASETITGGVKVSQSAAADHGVPSERGRCPGAGAAPPDETISTVALRIGGSRSITVERTGVTTTAEGCTWHGVVRETGESALLMWWTDGRLSGVLGYRGRVYKIHNTGGEAHAVLESPPRNAPSGHPLRSFGETADPSGPDGRPTGGSEAPAPAAHVPRPAVPFTDAERHRLEAKRIVIDLMVLYTKKAASRYMIALADLVAHAVEQTNVSFRNSGLENIRLRLVHTELVDYEETPGGHFDHLYHMVDGVGPFSDVRKLRDEKRADVVGLIVEDPSGCGLTTRIAPDPEEAYFVVHHSCAAIMISIAHEIGHVLGARHDPGTDALNSPFPYGHGYVNGTKWRDIMSYQQSCGGCPRIPHWSNPRILYKGEPTGTDANDNARAILEQAERVSRFR